MQQFHLTKTDNSKDYSINQGETFQNIVIKYPGDMTAWNVRGQIRKNYADKTDEILAEFEFDELTYDSDLNLTIIHPTLSAETTQDLPKPLKVRANSQDAVIVGTNAWVYDIELYLNNEVIKVIGGYVEINREVTR